MVALEYPTFSKTFVHFYYDYFKIQNLSTNNYQIFNCTFISLYNLFSLDDQMYHDLLGKKF